MAQNCSRKRKEHLVEILPFCSKQGLSGFCERFPDFLAVNVHKSIFKNGARCDILDLTEGTIYEILCSETEERFEEKIKNYPKELKIVKIRC